MLLNNLVNFIFNCVVSVIRDVCNFNSQVEPGSKVGLTSVVCNVFTVFVFCFSAKDNAVITLFQLARVINISFTEVSGKFVIVRNVSVRTVLHVDVIASAILGVQMGLLHRSWDVLADICLVRVMGLVGSWSVLNFILESFYRFIGSLLNDSLAWVFLDFINSVRSLLSLINFTNWFTTCGVVLTISIGLTSDHDVIGPVVCITTIATAACRYIITWASNILRVCLIVHFCLGLGF